MRRGCPSRMPSFFNTHFAMIKIMKNNPYDSSKWKQLIPDIENIISEMNKTHILSVGVTPYTRIIPAFFLDNYSIYSVKRSSDVDILDPFLKISVLEDQNPHLASRVHGTGFLIKTPDFQKLYKSFPVSPYLMFYTMTEGLVDDLLKLQSPFIGNDPYICDEVKYKGTFRELLKKLNIKTPLSVNYLKNDFFNSEYKSIERKFNGSFVVQRSDKETGGNEGTFFIHTEKDFSDCINSLKKSDDFNELVLTKFIKGYSTSMLGCAIKQGILSGPLQIQFVDVKESLQGLPKNGIFFGNDLEFRGWGEDIEKKAEIIVERVGKHLYENNYRGIFGIDFLYDELENEIYAIECNPRFTGSLLLYSLSLLEANIPPMEFFHLLSHLQIDTEFDFEKVNNALKQRSSYSHISFSPKEIESMKLPFVAGVYSYDKGRDDLVYKCAGVSLSDLKDKNDFLIIDTVPKVNKLIERNVPRLFKFIFPYSIAKSSNEIEERAAFLVDRFAKTIIESSKN